MLVLSIFRVPFPLAVDFSRMTIQSPMGVSVVVFCFAVLCSAATALSSSETTVSCRPEHNEIVSVDDESLTLKVALPGPTDPSHITLCLHVHSYLFASQAIFNVRPNPCFLSFLFFTCI